VQRYLNQNIVKTVTSLNIYPSIGSTFIGGNDTKYKQDGPNMKKYIVFAGLFVSMAIQAQTVRVAAASSLRYILEEAKTKYLEQNPHDVIEISLGASGALTQQIIHGAPFDFFMSADARFPEKLKEEGCTIGEISTYGFGKLVLWSNTLDVSKGMIILGSNQVHRIALANPEVAPYGEAAVQCLKFYKLYDELKPKIIYADNISQAAQFAETGNAEAALVAYSLIASPELNNKGTYYIPDPKSYNPVEQTCVLLKNSTGNAEPLKFMNFVLSNTCKPLFEKYGFVLNAN
jgi:molybdate transport system substrate-binding protein